MSVRGTSYKTSRMVRAALTSPGSKVTPQVSPTREQVINFIDDSQIKEILTQIENDSEIEKLVTEIQKDTKTQLDKKTTSENITKLVSIINTNSSVKKIFNDLVLKISTKIAENVCSNSYHLQTLNILVKHIKIDVKKIKDTELYKSLKNICGNQTRSGSVKQKNSDSVKGTIKGGSMKRKTRSNKRKSRASGKRRIQKGGGEIIAIGISLAVVAGVTLVIHGPKEFIKNFADTLINFNNFAFNNLLSAAEVLKNN